MVSALVLGWALGLAGAAEPDAVKPLAPDLVAYEAAKAGVGRDADAHVALALWCEAHAMPAEKAKHLARAVLIDPSNARARGLLGYVRHDGKWLRPEDVTRTVEESPERQAVYREYQERRVKARDKADDQYKLAQWCEAKGLDQQATAHYHRVVELDPGRDVAWKRLGFKKVSGRWVKPEELAAAKAEHEAQAKADKLWKPKLEHLKESLSSRDKAKQAEAEKALAAIVDPRAAPMVWAVFARGGERWQHVAARIFGQIDAPGASTALTMLAVFSPVANVRSEASQLLTRRDPREFARLLAGLIQDEIKYKKTNVAGPGSRGELFIEGKDANVKRFYTPMSLPNAIVMPGDQLRIDESGMLVASRPIGLPYVGQGTTPTGFGSIDELRAATTTRFEQAFQPLGMPAKFNHQLRQTFTNNSIVGPQGSTGTPTRAPGRTTVSTSPIIQDTLQIPVGLMIFEAKQSAVVAQQQLAADVQQIDSHNAPIRQTNERAIAILRSVSGQDLGSDPEKWTAWAVDLQGYAFRTTSQTTPPPTFLEEVPLDYQPQAFPVVASQVVGTAVSTRTTGASNSCFAAGTKVRTLRGGRPIESIRPGDEVLSQDTASGVFRYRPVVTAYHNPPNETFRLDLGKESIVATGIHRFWKAGRGWIMAREVKAGDHLRTIGGAVEVVAVTKDQVQPVFNLQLDGGDDFCVGEQGVIAHDNSFVDPVEHPFDGVPAELRSNSKP